MMSSSGGLVSPATLGIIAEFNQWIYIWIIEYALLGKSRWTRWIYHVPQRYLLVVRHRGWVNPLHQQEFRTWRVSSSFRISMDGILGALQHVHKCWLNCELNHIWLVVPTLFIFHLTRGWWFQLPNFFGEVAKASAARPPKCRRLNGKQNAKKLYIEKKAVKVSWRSLTT